MNGMLCAPPKGSAIEDMIVDLRDARLAPARRDIARVKEERARGVIQQERDSAISELRSEFADLTIAAAEKIIGQALDPTAHRRLIDQALSESSFRDN